MVERVGVGAGRIREVSPLSSSIIASRLSRTVLSELMGTGWLEGGEG